MSKSNPKKTCRKKKVYNSMMDAVKWAQIYAKEFKSFQGVYTCPVCNKFHLTTHEELII